MQQTLFTPTAQELIVEIDARSHKIDNLINKMKQHLFELDIEKSAIDLNILQLKRSVTVES